MTRETLPPLRAAVVTVAGCAVASSGGLVVPVAAIAAIGFVALGVLRPLLFLGLFLLVRPVLAAVSDGQLVHGVASGNADGLIALLLIAIATVALVGTRPLLLPALPPWFAIVLGISAISAVDALGTLGRTVGTAPISELGRLGAELATYLMAVNLVGTSARARRAFQLVALSAVAPATIGVVQLIQ